MSNCSPISMPIVLKENFQYDDNDLFDTKTYRSLMGALQYLNFTRLNITFAVNLVYQHLNQPTKVHLLTAKRILHYL